MGESGPSRDMTNAEKMAKVLEEAGKTLILQEREVAQARKAFADLGKVLQEKTYLITNLETGEKHIGDLDEYFSVMVEYFKHENTLEKFHSVVKIEKVKPETAAVLYGQIKKDPQP